MFLLLISTLISFTEAIPNVNAICSPLRRSVAAFPTIQLAEFDPLFEVGISFPPRFSGFVIPAFGDLNSDGT